MSNCIPSKTLSNARKYYDNNRRRRPGGGKNWKRVLIAFGDIQDNNLSPMTAKEARDRVSRWSGWAEFADALECLEREAQAQAASRQRPQKSDAPPPPLASPAVSSAQNAKHQRIDERMKRRMRDAGYSPTEPTFDDVTSHEQWERKSIEWERWQDELKRQQKIDFEEYHDDYVSDGSNVHSYYMDRWGNAYTSKEGRLEGVAQILAKQGYVNEGLISDLLDLARSEKSPRRKINWLRAAKALGSDSPEVSSVTPMTTYQAMVERDRGYDVKRWWSIVENLETVDRMKKYK